METVFPSGLKVHRNMYASKVGSYLVEKFDQECNDECIIGQ